TSGTVSQIGESDAVRPRHLQARRDGVDGEDAAGPEQLGPVGKLSDSRIACSSPTSGGSLTRLAWANGTRANSACSPWNRPDGAGAAAERRARPPAGWGGPGAPAPGARPAG